MGPPRAGAGQVAAQPWPPAALLFQTRPPPGQRPRSSEGCLRGLLLSRVAVLHLQLSSCASPDACRSSSSSPGKRREAVPEQVVCGGPSSLGSRCWGPLLASGLMCSVGEANPEMSGFKWILCLQLSWMDAASRVGVGRPGPGHTPPPATFLPRDTSRDWAGPSSLGPRHAWPPLRIAPIPGFSGTHCLAHPGSLHTCRSSEAPSHSKAHDRPLCFEL